MNDTLIAVMSCWDDRARGAHDAIRQTWVSRMVPTLDYKIFVGRPENPFGKLYHDEEQLDVIDQYGGLPWKSQAIRRWALDHGYKWVFKADRDTYINPARLADSGYRAYDYAGHFPKEPVDGPVPTMPDPKGRYIYASGGPGYWTSVRAMEVIVAAPVDEKAQDNYGSMAEDLWMANILIPAGMQGWHDHRYMFKGSALVPEAISIHLSTHTGGYHPSWLLNAHKWSK